LTNLDAGTGIHGDSFPSNSDNPNEFRPLGPYADGRLNRLQFWYVIVPKNVYNSNQTRCFLIRTA
jgi:hypothetical protein